MTDPRRHPVEFLDQAREIIRGWEQNDDPPINAAAADQMRAADENNRTKTRRIAE
jgi:hypothetical protein